MSKYDQQKINRLSGGKPISYCPQLALLLGSIEAGILIDYLLYLQGTGSKGDWVYKTRAHMELETGLTRSNQDTAIKRCKALGILEVQRKGVPAKRHFKVSIRMLEAIIPSLRDSCKLDGLEPAIQSAAMQATTTKSYPERTSKSSDEIEFQDKRRQLISKMRMR